VAIFRAGAIEAVLARKALLERERTRSIAGELRDIYKSNPQALAEDYGQIMILANHSNEQIREELDRYEKSMNLERDMLLNELTLRMSLTDIDIATRLRWHRSTEHQRS
jgi:hypothetical protein